MQNKQIENAFHINVHDKDSSLVAAWNKDAKSNFWKMYSSQSTFSKGQFAVYRQHFLNIWLYSASMCVCRVGLKNKEYLWYYMMLYFMMLAVIIFVFDCIMSSSQKSVAVQILVVCVCVCARSFTYAWYENINLKIKTHRHLNIWLFKTDRFGILPKV